MKTYKVFTNEILYYCKKEVEANSEEEAKNKYFEMIALGEVEVNKSSYCDITINNKLI